MSERFPPLMLVDGYNVIGAWQRLKALSYSYGLEQAREGLIETLTNYSAYQGYKTVVVFDAYNVDTPGISEKITKNLKLYYTEYRQTADSYIEKECGKYHRDPLRHLKRIIVVTSDQAQSLTTTGFGAECISAIALEQEVELTMRSVQHRQKPAKASAKHLLGNLIDDHVRAQLSKLRQDLDKI
jgi:uncharacterized protein